MSQLLELYLSFVKIGAFTFGGGYASLPLIEDIVVNEQGWLTATEMVDVISISNMTPGPIGINAATFVGTKLGGIPGSVFATAGYVTPSAILMIALGYLLFATNKDVSFLDRILIMLRPTIVGLIAIAAINMTQASVLMEGSCVLDFQINTLEMITFVVGLILYYKKVDLTKLIILGAVLGIGLSFIV